MLAPKNPLPLPKETFLCSDFVNLVRPALMAFNSSKYLSQSILLKKVSPKIKNKIRNVKNI